MNHTITPTREELYEALSRATDSLDWLLKYSVPVDNQEWKEILICRAVAADVRKMLDARPKL